MIDDKFIERWEPKYDCIECDEEKYQCLLKDVKKEIEQSGSLSKTMLKEVFRWKKPAILVWHHVENADYDKYEKAFRDAFLEKDILQKIKILIECDNNGRKKLPGIGIPVASTILHFRCPLAIPIIDRRTVEVLRYFKCLEGPTSCYTEPRKKLGYHTFHNRISGIQRKCAKQWNLRQIDRALFAYHKIELSGSTKVRQGC